jgi:hypothetical protein
MIGTINNENNGHVIRKKNPGNEPFLVIVCDTFRHRIVDDITDVGSKTHKSDITKIVEKTVSADPAQLFKNSIQDAPKIRRLTCPAEIYFEEKLD